MKRAIGLLGIIAAATGLIGPGMTMPANEQVRHIVIFKYKEGAPEEQIRSITDAFRSLRNKIPGIVSFEYGVNNSPEGFNRGFTHAHQLTFENAAARDAYLPHPEHVKFTELLKASGIFEDVFVVDYVPSD